MGLLKGRGGGGGVRRYAVLRLLRKEGGEEKWVYLYLLLKVWSGLKVFEK